MPKYYEEDSLKERRPCDGIREDFKACLINSECVKGGDSARDCIKGNKVPECEPLRKTFFECKRSLLDMRTRFRGRKDY